MRDEQKLITQCLSGDRRAEKQLYDTYSALFFGICLRYAEHREEAEDMLVTGFTRIFAKLSTYKMNGSFEGWMKRIMVNNAIDYVRSRQTKETLPLDEAEAVPDNGLQKLEAKDVLTCIQQLPPKLRTIFNLFAVEGFSHREIAQMLQMNESSVRVYFFKAKKQLQELLKDYR